jgi:Tol biopolymer transport system component
MTTKHFNITYKNMTFLLLALALLQSCNQQPKNTETAQVKQDSSAVHYPEESHLANVKQLSFGGENAEAYWSFDNTRLTFQHTNKPQGLLCDQIFMLTLTDTTRQLISTGKGRTTCSYFMPGDTQIIYASTHLSGDSCPAEPPHVHGKYLWSIYGEYEIFIADLKGNINKQLTKNKFYDAEATVSPKGDKIIFTSDRSGDLELYTMNPDGSNVKQITNELGYDGGACFSPDGSQIIWRASVFTTDSEKTEYKENLKKHLVSPMKMELFIANADGSNRRQLTTLGGANWAPCFDPTGKKVLFSTNHKTKSIPFNLYSINTDGTNLQQITHDKVFDAFAMFSYDGKKLAWCSNRNNGGTRETNIFVADWVE